MSHSAQGRILLKTLVDLSCYHCINSPVFTGKLMMLGPKQEAQGPLFCEFSIDDHVPQDHQLRLIDRFVDLSSIRPHLAEFYSHTGRPSIDPELLIRMLLVGYCLGIRSERRLCEEVHLNLAYRGADRRIADAPVWHCILWYYAANRSIICICHVDHFADEIRFHGPIAPVPAVRNFLTLHTGCKRKHHCKVVMLNILRCAMRRTARISVIINSG